MAKNPSDPTRHTPPAGQRPVDEERQERAQPDGPDRSQLEHGQPAPATEQPGRGNNSGK